MKLCNRRLINRLLKNLFDRFFALLGLIILTPFLLIIVILIHIKMPGSPIIFKQNRVGLNGKIFIMYKFSSMFVNHSGVTITVAGEHRITKFGAFIRKYKIDELPELWNVLKGDMSLVGPRPDVAGYADSLKGSNRIILSVRPGITGPASIKYRNEEDILSKVANPIKYNDTVLYPDKVRINQNYIREWSFWLDLRIIIYTIIGKSLNDSRFD